MRDLSDGRALRKTMSKHVSKHFAFYFLFFSKTDVKFFPRLHPYIPKMGAERKSSEVLLLSRSLLLFFEENTVSEACGRKPGSMIISFKAF